MLSFEDMLVAIGRHFGYEYIRTITAHANRKQFHDVDAEQASTHM